jgi:hypothetical protein
VAEMPLFKKKPESEEIKKLRENARNCGHCEEMAKITVCAIFRAANEITVSGGYDSWGKLLYCCPLFKEIPQREFPKVR